MKRHFLWRVLFLLIMGLLLWLYIRYAQPLQPTSLQGVDTTSLSDDTAAKEEAERKRIEQAIEVNIPQRPIAEVTELAEDQTAPVTDDAKLYTIQPGSQIDWLLRGVGDNQIVGVVDIPVGDLFARGGAAVAGKASIDMTTLQATQQSDDKDLTEMFKGDDFFAVTTYPATTFELLTVGTTTVSGILTMKGVSKIITFPATIIIEEDIVMIHSEFALDRTQWGVNGQTGVLSDYLEVTFRLTWTS